jgi:hypothetical protein
MLCVSLSLSLGLGLGLGLGLVCGAQHARPVAGVARSLCNDGRKDV